MRVRPGAVLMVNGHFLNPSSEKSTPEVRVNLYTIPESELKEEGDILFLYNPFIHVGANGKSRARMRCPVHKDITLVNAQSHMHARGIGYEASVVGDAQPFYTHTHWESVPIKEFGDGLHIKAGSFLDYHCDYNNAATRDIFQGPSAKDEMCMLVGSYYPANEATTNCLEDPLLPIDQNSMGGEWVGNGTTSCANTLGCIQSAQDFNILQSCIVASDPAVSKEMSAAVRCIFKSANPLASCQTEFSQCLAK